MLVGKERLEAQVYSIYSVGLLPLKIYIKKKKIVRKKKKKLDFFSLYILVNLKIDI